MSYTRTVVSAGVLSGFLLIPPQAGAGHESTAGCHAQSGRQTSTSHSERAELWRDQVSQLRRHLPAGHEERFYRDRLADRGWRISSVNDDYPTYLEYEVIRGDLTAEVQIKLDGETGRATQVAVLANPILTPETERELARNDKMSRLARHHTEDVSALPWWQGEGDLTPLASRFRFSDRERSRMETMLQDLRALPVGHDREFYRRALQRRGYDITATPVDSPSHLQLEAAKGDHVALVTVMFDKNSRQSTAVYAVPFTGQHEFSQQMDLAAGSAARGDEARSPVTLMGEGSRMKESHLRPLPTGREQEFYRRALRERGYRIANVFTDESFTRFQVEKDGKWTAVHVEFDPDTGKSVRVAIRRLFVVGDPDIQDQPELDQSAQQAQR